MKSVAGKICLQILADGGVAMLYTCLTREASSISIKIPIFLSHCFEYGIGTSSTASTAKPGLESCLLHSSRLHSLSLAMHLANAHLSIGNIIAVLSLLVAIPCTAIMLWKFFWRQQRDSHDTRTFWTGFQFIGQTSDEFKMI